jgi:hypothetical protein
MGLTARDLDGMVEQVFEIDSHSSKMGSDANVVVISFTVREEAPAQDLVAFIEKGYSFVLDADCSSGEQDDGMYRVFVEIERDPGVAEQIMELMDGVSKLSGRDDFEFRYYKSFESSPLNIEELTNSIPTDRESYESVVTETNMNNFKNFFNRSYLDEVTLTVNQELSIKKAFADPVVFKIKGFGESVQVDQSITERINVDAYAELLFLTKYIGNYNITKFGEHTLTFENSGHMLVLERL